ncbi:hypothetical protein FSARC_14238 [Fusarium sarcochroum]|uniref:Uncharacterized protein n=1 Tax=Fusarium sarcochroum TaxID=1208366 RepID=A0A8H4WQN2_9HYPO|nr:hypothetical protein FSARC_14238 [Fusarium sarcochroum]
MPDISTPALPVLRLRGTTATELVIPHQKIKQPDGPWIAHPDLIDEEFNSRYKIGNHLPDITMADCREIWKEQLERQKDMLRGSKPEDFEMRAVIAIGQLVNMPIMLGMADHKLALAVEKQYVGAHHYLLPRFLTSPSCIDAFGSEWGMNARGIYYRHYYSPAWVTADHSLWLPSLDGTDWTHHAEEGRRARARSFVKHTLNNEGWAKSEYAWEADAWTDIFGFMRDDPVLSVSSDKHEYNTMGKKVHPVSCLLTGESRLIKRIPDATFGLSTFKPRHYQNCIGQWDLDHDRLEALKVHRHCGLRSDPRWSTNNLAFPFAAYEAKGWSGDCREARRQACSAGAVYLDMLDRLARTPGKLGDKPGAYQTDQSRSTQVFTFTSFGAHWHISVGYKRPRLRREFAGREGMSESVYVFQRIWSGRVTTERRAWELLSLIDQIHLWGATDFRDFVIRHLKPWHEFCKACYINDVDFACTAPETSTTFRENNHQFKTAGPVVQLPGWAKHLQEETRLKLEDSLGFHLFQALIKYRAPNQPKSDRFPDMRRCAIDQCGVMAEDPGYPLASMEEVETHLREEHGLGFQSVVEMQGDIPTRDNMLRYKFPCLVRKYDKRHREGSIDGDDCTVPESSPKRKKRKSYYRP